MTKNKPTHYPDDNTLKLLITNKLNDTERARVEHHLDDCPTCAQLIAEIAHTTPHHTIPKHYRLTHRINTGAINKI